MHSPLVLKSGIEDGPRYITSSESDDRVQVTRRYSNCTFIEVTAAGSRQPVADLWALCAIPFTDWRIVNESLNHIQQRVKLDLYNL